MKKAMIFIMALMLVLVCFAGCSKNDNPDASPSKPPVNIDDYIFPDLPAAGTYDFGGKTITVVSYHAQGFEQRGDYMRRFTQDLQIEQRFNVKIAYSFDFTQHQNDAIAGNPSADIVWLMNHQVTQYVKAGALEPMQDYKNELKLDTNDRYDQELLDWCTINGNLYGLGLKPEELWKYHYVNVMFMNTDLLQNRGINADDIYTMQENKEWTWAKFKEVAKKVTNDINGDGVPDIFGTTISGVQVLESYMVSNGSNFLKHENSKFIFDVDAKGIAAINYMKDLVTDGAARTTQANGGYSHTQDVADFIGGKIGFSIQIFQRTWQAGYLPDMQYPYGVVSVPMGPDADDYYYSDTMYAVYSMFAQPDKERAKELAEFLYLYTTSLYESEEDEVEAYWDEANNRIFDDGSEYVLNRIFENTNVIRNNNYMFTHGGLFGFSIDEVIGGVKTAQQLIEEIGNRCQNFLDTLFAT